MNTREYTAADKEACMNIFKSNCPKFFDPEELPPFGRWLDRQAAGECALETSEKECYYVFELPGKGIVACAGFYALKELNEARFAWGMVHSAFHKQGIGTLTYTFRMGKMKELWPGHKITLGTSQHTFRFYEQMGMKVVNIIPKGYGEFIDRYDMEL